MSLSIFASIFLLAFAGVVCNEPDQSIHFVLSARNLPDTDNLGTGSPDAYVEIVYIGGIYTSNKPFTIKTERLNNNHNPDWPEQFHFTYHSGQGQLFEFIVYDHNRLTKNHPIGSVKLSAAEIAKADKNMLELMIVGKGKETGTLIIYTKVNNVNFEETDRRLRDHSAKVHHIGVHAQVKYVE